MTRREQRYGCRVAKQVIQAGAEATGQHLCNSGAVLHICKVPPAARPEMRGLTSLITQTTGPGAGDWVGKIHMMGEKIKSLVFGWFRYTAESVTRAML